MRPALLILAALCALGASAAHARAQDTFETVAGNTYQGSVVSNDGVSVEIQTTDGMTMKLPLEALTPETQYRLRRADTTDDAQSQLDLAEWCVTKTLYEEARIHFRKALAADPLMADKIKERVVVARATAAKELLARAKSLQASNQDQEARRILSLLVQELPLEEPAKEAARMLDEDTAKRKATVMDRSPAKASSGPAEGGAGEARRSDGEPFSDATRSLFEPIIKSYQKLLDANRVGLGKEGSGGIDEFEKALKESEKIRKEAEKLRPKGANDAEVTEALALVDTKLEEASVDTRLNIVNAYLLRTSYNQAADVVNKGLAEYPKNERLLQARNHVSAAANNGGGGDWVIGGRRG